MIEFVKRMALVLVAAAALSAVPASAQQTELAPEHMALARQYVDLTNKSGIYEVAILEVAVRTMETLLRQNPELETPVDEAIKKTLDGYKGNSSQLLDQFARVYAANFTMEELQQIVTFYETPTGQKLAAANASLNGSLQTVMQVFQAQLNTEFFAKVRTELRTAGYNL